MTAAELQPVFNSLLDIIVTVIVGLVSLAVNKFIKDKNARDALTGALSNAAGIGLAYGQKRGDQWLQDTTIKSGALQAMANYVTDQAPKALAHFGQTDADVATKVEGTLAKALSLATPIPDAPKPVEAAVVEAVPEAPKPTIIVPAVA